METEYLYPAFSDRTTPKVWAELGKRDLIERAIEEKNKILDNFFPGHLSAEIDAELRRNFPIRLPLETMRSK